MISQTRHDQPAGTGGGAPGDTAATATDRRPGAEPRRFVGRTIGILILAGWLTYGPGHQITAAVLGAADPLASVAANTTTFVAGAVLMLLNSAAVVGIGVMWYPVLRRHSERVAVGYLGTRLVEAVLCALGVISLLSLVAVADQYAVAGTDAGPHFATIRALAVHVNDLSYQIGMAALGAGSVFFCALLYRTGIAPKALAAWGVVGYAVFCAGMMLDVFGLDVGLLLSAPGGLFELVFATWLILKGPNPTAVIPASEPTFRDTATARAGR